MAVRADGQGTRLRLLEVAAERFSVRGYRDTTVAEICEGAGANVAAVNYHFGGKDALYVAVFRRALERALERYPADGGVPADASPEERLRGRIMALLNKRFDDGEFGQLHRMLSMELAQPTGLIDDLRREVIGPQRRVLREILSSMLGPSAADRDLIHCESSIVNQCLAARFSREHRAMFFGCEELAPADIEALADHITRFSLAGIEAARAFIERRERGSSAKQRRARS